MLLKTESAHEELATAGGTRAYAVSTKEFLADSAGRVRALRLVDVEGPAAKFAPIPARNGSPAIWSLWRWGSRRGA